MSTTRLSNQKRSTEAFIAAWKDLSIEKIVALRAPECIQETIPKDTLQVPDQTNDEWAAALKPAFGSLSNFKAIIHSTTHDAEAGRTVLFATTTGDAPWGDYRNTHIMIFTWNEDGTKMVRIQDMMDSAEMIKRMGMIEKWMAKQG